MHRRNPTFSDADLVLAGLGVALAAGIGVWVYVQSQMNEEAASSTPIEGTFPQGVFSSGATSSVGPAASMQGEVTFQQAPGPIGPTQLPLGPPPVAPIS